ncbi:AraC family transcriptional regulator [Paenibacillus curdlanolyticus]|uniref:AraC family transcriptional regulator n=1 Tax=Paenibacillus curdlanolyticus TaxID=59840 RepID=UPI0002F83160|nr:AraC family transcriptional regulator [Paenibacillus curdlanolyticus]
MSTRRTKEGIRNKPAAAVAAHDLQMIYWGAQANTPGQSWGPGVKDHHKLYFARSGRGSMTYRGQTHSIQSGQGFYAPPNEVYSYTADMDDPWKYNCIAFVGQQADLVLERTTLTVNPVFDQPAEMDSSWFDRLAETSERPGGDLLQQATLYELLATLIRLAPAEQQAPDARKPREEYVRQAADFIHRHYDEEVTIRQLSEYLGLDRKYVATLFREALGMPPQQYLLHYRMEKAKELLRSTGLSVTETARSVGYKDALLFSRMFKKVVGVAPSHYVQQLAKP